MPQDVRELGRRVKAKYPGKYDDLADEDVGRRVKRKYPGAYDDFTDTPAAVSNPPIPGFATAMQDVKNLGTGIGQGALDYVVNPALALSEAVGSAATGNFTPLGQIGESALRGAGQFVGYLQGAAPRDTRLPEIQAEQAKRREFSPGFEQARLMGAGLEQFAAQDPSLRGKIGRGVGRFIAGAAPAVATGVLSGGSVPAMAATTALQSAAQPEALIPATFAGALPLPVGQAFKAATGAVRRALGKGAAQIVEAEAAPIARETVPAVGETIPAPPNAPANPLQSAFAKLETDNVEQIGEMIANANRRLNKTITVPGGTKRPRTTTERLSSWEDYKALKQLTPDEQRALGQVLPARTVSPIRPDYAGEGSPSRDISDIPNAEPNAQLDANLRELEAFFTQEGRAAAPTAPAGRVVTVGDKTYTLTPEQEARWVAEVEEPLASARRQAKELRATGRGSDRQRADEIMRGESMSAAARKRQIVGALTPKEEAAIAARAATNYKDKPVTVDIGGRQVNGTVQGTAFGRIKVKLEDGQTVTVAPSSITAQTKPDIAGQVAGMARTPTSPVSLPQLRAEFPGMPKQQFDDEVLKLAEEGQIALHRNDAPGLLSEAERQNMVKIGNDYYTAATVRGPRVSAPMDLNATVAKAAESTPRAQRAKDELLGLLGASKSLRSTADISYPLRQGALLLLRPLQWRQAGKVWKEMFRGFRTKNFDAIKEAIDNHPLTERMNAAGLQRFPKAGEEAFAKRAGSKISEAVSKAPIIKQSDQAYAAAAATQRVQAFEQYTRLIDKAGLTAEEALKADKAAAQWINIATGRGSLGKRLDKAMEGLNFFFFSPRYVASRLNVFNPAMYIRNASSPGGRVVLKQQMSDLMQFASVVATTMYLAKQAGADVGLNPNSPDFLKIRFGNTRYDLGAGLTQVMRLIYRVGADIGRAGRGEKPKFGQSAIDIGETFLSYKLSPPAGVFRDFIKQRTVEGKPFSASAAARDLAVPMQWADFVEAYQKEAWGGVAKTLPGVAGVGVQNYESPPVQAAIDKHQPLFSELQRLNKRVTELRRKEGEKDDAFNARVQQFSANYTRFGQELLNSPRFQAAPDNIKALALDRLNERAKHITSHEFAFPEIELDANFLMDAAELSKKNPANK